MAAWVIFVLNIVILSFTPCLSLSFSPASRLNPELSNHLPNFSLKRTLKFPPPLCASHPCHMILLFSRDLLRQTSLKNGPHLRTQTRSLLPISESGPVRLYRQPSREFSKCQDEHMATTATIFQGDYDYRELWRQSGVGLLRYCAWSLKQRWAKPWKLWGIPHACTKRVHMRRTCD